MKAGSLPPSMRPPRRSASSSARSVQLPMPQQVVPAERVARCGQRAEQLAQRLVVIAPVREQLRPPGVQDRCGALQRRGEIGRRSDVSLPDLFEQQHQGQRLAFRAPVELVARRLVAHPAGQPRRRVDYGVRPVAGERFEPQLADAWIAVGASCVRNRRPTGAAEPDPATPARVRGVRLAARRGRRGRSRARPVRRTVRTIGELLDLPIDRAEHFVFGRGASQAIHEHTHDRGRPSRAQPACPLLPAGPSSRAPRRRGSSDGRAARRGSRRGRRAPARARRRPGARRARAQEGQPVVRRGAGAGRVRAR